MSAPTKYAKQLKPISPIWLLQPGRRAARLCMHKTSVMLDQMIGIFIALTALLHYWYTLELVTLLELYVFFLNYGFSVAQN